jgi:hypothetical protein
MKLIPYSMTSLMIGIGIAVTILVLVRKNHLMVNHSVWWLMIAVSSIILGVYPRIVDHISRLLGVHYPPTLLFTIGIALILIKMLTMELNQAEQERKIRRLTQKLAILENDGLQQTQPGRDVNGKPDNTGD